MKRLLTISMLIVGLALSVYGQRRGMVVPCDTDTDCERKNPGLAGNGRVIDFNLGPVVAEDSPRWDCRTMGNKVWDKPTCDAVTKTGGKCKRRVREAGLVCWQHRARA